jgi:hypothetical protein
MSGTMHTYHPDSHTHGLADGCPRCAEHAADPHKSLDRANMRALLDRIADSLGPRSEAERKAMNNLGIGVHTADVLRKTFYHQV